MEVEHHIREHPLIPWEVQTDGEEKPSCYGCLLPLSSGNAAYSCTQCKFNFHKSCAELPKNIIHFLHPKHSLILLVRNPYSCYLVCDNCNDTIWGFGYHCSICRFDLDIKCVSSLGQVIESEGHQHSFMLHRPISFTCDACGEVGDEMSYICTICQLWIHKKCASLPPTIKHIGHDHPLSLSHTLQLNDFSKEGLCQICSKQMNRFYWGYRCSECSYIAHLSCATFNHLGGDENDPSLVSLPDENDRLSDDVEGISLAENNEMVLNELKHFSHGHCLILSKDEPEKKEICDGCTRSISSPYYKCTDQCNFFLHVSCAELPNMKLHPFHPHPLTLRYDDNRPSVWFNCSVCTNIGNGFSYHCDSCKFKIDVRCASFLSIRLRHGGHKHTLNLVRKNIKTRCSACGLDCFDKFRCEGCDFNLDLDCASLPYTARHRWDDHTLKLT